MLTALHKTSVSSSGSSQHTWVLLAPVVQFLPFCISSPSAPLSAVMSSALPNGLIISLREVFFRSVILSVDINYLQEKAPDASVPGLMAPSRC